MKKALLTIMLSMGLTGSVNAEPLTGVIFYALTGGTVFYGGTQLDKPVDQRLFKTITVAHSDNPTGYSFDVTQFEYDQNPSAYVK